MKKNHQTSIYSLPKSLKNTYTHIAGKQKGKKKATEDEKLTTRIFVIRARGSWGFCYLCGDERMLFLLLEQLKAPWRVLLGPGKMSQTKENYSLIKCQTGWRARGKPTQMNAYGGAQKSETTRENPSILHFSNYKIYSFSSNFGWDVKLEKQEKRYSISELKIVNSFLSWTFILFSSWNFNDNVQCLIWCLNSVHTRRFLLNKIHRGSVVYTDNMKMD